MSHKYYSPLRPLSLGTFPKPQGNEILHIENFEERQNVPEIARQAWGYIEYKEALTEIEAAAYELIPSNCMTDEQQRTYLESIRRTRFKTLIMTAHIDKAVEEIERRREAAGRGVEYKAFEMYFMQGMDYAEIAEELDTGKNTPRRWVTGIINELSVLLWGIDEERVK